jgi:hypothetical protein
MVVDPIDWAHAMQGVNPTDLVVLTLPGAALALRLTKITKKYGGGRPRGRGDAAVPPMQAAGKPGGRKKLRLLPKGLLGRTVARFLPFLTAVSWALAGLGLVPAALVIYKAISKTSPWTPLIAGVVLVSGLAFTGLKMFKDLKDGRMDKPALWLPAASIIAVLFLVGPIWWQQATDQAHRSVRMMFGQSTPSEHPAEHHKKPSRHHDSKGSDSKGSDDGQNGDERP